MASAQHVADAAEEQLDHDKNLGWWARELLFRVIGQNYDAVGESGTMTTKNWVAVNGVGLSYGMAVDRLADLCLSRQASVRRLGRWSDSMSGYVHVGFFLDHFPWLCFGLSKDGTKVTMGTKTTKF